MESKPPSTLVQVNYTNWKGENSDRTLLPIYIWFGSTQWHPVSQWLLRAQDTVSGEVKDFAMADIHSWGTV